MTIWRVPITISGPALPDPAANIWHVRTGGGLVGEVVLDGLQEAVDALHAFYDSIKGLYPAGNTIALGEGVQEINTNSPAVPPSLTFANVGGTGGDGLPAADCLLVTWRTSLANRRGRGRTFIGPVVRTAVEANGTPEESNRSALGAAASALVDASASAGDPAWAIGVWSPTDKVLRDFTAYSVPNRMGVLRSRRD